MLSQIQPEADLFGLPLPRDDREFVIAVVIHIVLSLSAIVFGLIAMLSDKNSGRHSKFGQLYYWFILFAFVTVITLVIMRWPHNNHLFVIGVLTVFLVLIGRRLAQNKKANWARHHAIFMGGSYILLLTGFYVDNGAHLPFWRQFPQWFFYIFPALIGVPIIVIVLRKHPLTRKSV